MIENTMAMSLLYECINTATTGGMLNLGKQSDALAAACVNKLRVFLESDDQNRTWELLSFLYLYRILVVDP
jgi:AP-3 complex subunit delta